MADAVTSQTIIDGERNCVMKFTNVSDGTGESAVAKVDVSALAANYDGVACSEVRIMRISHAIVGMSVQVFLDASSNVLLMELAESSNGHMDFADSVDFLIMQVVVKQEMFCLLLKVIQAETLILLF